MSAPGAVAVTRGCGTRQAGGVYIETGMGPGGSPVEDFLCDPPIPVPEEINLTPIGMEWFIRNGVWHVMDHVGSKHYENVADFVEEVRRFGLSRRIAKTAPFHQLTEQSRIFLVHSRAIITKPEQYRPAGSGYYCPFNLKDHQAGDCMCVGIWWEDVGDPDAEGQRESTRAMPAFTYTAKTPPPGVRGPYERGIFAAFPITRLAVVEDEAGGSHDLAMKNASKAWLPVALVKE